VYDCTAAAEAVCADSAIFKKPRAAMTIDSRENNFHDIPILIDNSNLHDYSPPFFL